MGQAQDPCEHVVAIDDEPRHHLVIENEFVRGFAVEIAPHDRTLCHHHAHDYLLYVACIADIISAPRDQEPETLLYDDGDCELSPAGMIHVVQNLTERPFRNILVEFLPGAAELQRGPEPSPELATSRKRFVDPTRGAIYRLGLQRNSQVEILGPAIVASPYEHEIDVERTNGATIKLSRFNDLAWLPPAGRAVVRTPGSSATAIAFQLGSDEDRHSSVRKREKEPLKGFGARANSI